MLAAAALNGAIWITVSRLIGRLIDFLNLLILARMLSPEDFGITALAMALVMIIEMILEIPVSQALVRLPFIEKHHYDTGFTLGILKSLIVGIVIFVCAMPYTWINGDPALLPVICTLAIAPVVKGLSSPCMVVYARNIDFRPTFLADTCSKIVGLIAALLIVYSGGEYWALVGNFVVAACIGTIMTYILAPYRPALSLSRLQDFSGFIGWYTASQIVSAVNWQFDRLLMGSLAGGKAMLGNYTMASDIAALPTQTLIGPALQPLLAAFSRVNSDRERAGLVFLKAARIGMLISIPACSGLALTSDVVAEILLGPKWLYAGQYLSPLAFAAIPLPYILIMNALCLALDRANYVFRVNLISLLILVPAISIGYLLRSVDGVIWARLATSFVMFLVCLIQIRDLTDVSLRAQFRNLWKPGVAGIAMAVAVSSAHPAIETTNLAAIIKLLIFASVGAAVYGVTLFVLGLRMEIGRRRFAVYDRQS